ncbi:pentapeptide repeat-containing protein [Phototrophicus methaneseepsis]|uniref:Pentapeptide repeat-containing protein n=1 Tax=Phototrophicus methaneseepsis TaxID=2710758 RepID=A0A7S8EBL5_9CHLR|nr:pentapeptide repeat-containing protein [Phototrophicus methaneseepsis]QPC83973.1 pentapeptide repeat-containing protein [Phototrophicus methaneseepsis]
MLKRTLSRQGWAELLYLVVGIVLGLLINTLLESVGPPNYHDLLRDLLPEAVGITFTVLILDRLNAAREERQLKDQLIRRAHSRYNHTALEAIEDMRVLGYLEDGLLAARELRGSNWHSANLYKADLEECDLTNAVLKKADFVYANLKGAKVAEQQLMHTETMYGATMPDGSRYDGRYNLPGDAAFAKRSEVDTGSPEDMARWYGVSLERYLKGQQWAKQHLPRYQQPEG